MIILVIYVFFKVILRCFCTLNIMTIRLAKNKSSLVTIFLTAVLLLSGDFYNVKMVILNGDVYR